MRPFLATLKSSDKDTAPIALGIRERERLELQAGRARAVAIARIAVTRCTVLRKGGPTGDGIRRGQGSAHRLWACSPSHCLPKVPAGVAACGAGAADAGKTASAGTTATATSTKTSA